MSGFPVLHHLPEFTQTRVHWVDDAIQPSSPSPPALGLSQHQGLFQWVSSLHQAAKILELQLWHQSFQWVFRVDFLLDWLVWSPCRPRDSKESVSSTTIQKHQSCLFEPCSIIIAYSVMQKISSWGYWQKEEWMTHSWEGSGGNYTD